MLARRKAVSGDLDSARPEPVLRKPDAPGGVRNVEGASGASAVGSARAVVAEPLFGYGSTTWYFFTP